MPSCAVQTFTDPDDCALAIRGGSVELTVTEPGLFTATLTRIDFHRLWTQRFSDNLARIIHTANLAGQPNSPQHVLPKMNSGPKD
jgi:hypothetical protein